MVEINYNIAENYWSKDRFNATVKRRYADELNTIGQKLQGIHPDIILEAQELEERYNVTLVGKGNSRIVIEPDPKWINGDHNDVVLKLQWSQHVNQNFSEVKVWQNADGKTASMLAPVLDHDESMYLWELQAKTNTAQSLNLRQKRQAVREIRNKLRDTGYSPRDIQPRNIGTIDNRVVIHDYGMLEEA